MQTLGYGRVSSREQAENTHALEQQIARLKAAGASKIYKDIDSGSKDKRLEFNEVIELVKRGEVNEVIVTRLDRLTRSLPTLRKVLDIFKEHGVNLRALDDSIDTQTAAGKFHLNMLGALAEMEVDRLSERVRHGWQHLRDRRIAMNPPFGYAKINDGHVLDYSPFLCLIEGKQEMSRAQIARTIIEAFSKKRSLRLALREINEKYGIQRFAHPQRKKGRMARDLFQFSPAGLGDWLTNPVLRGHLCYRRKKERQRQKPSDWEIYYDTHPEHRLISEEEYREIESILAYNRQVRGYSSTAQRYPLSGLVYCAECRATCYAMTGSRGKTPGLNYYYQCKNWRERACLNKKTIRMEKVEEAVIDALVQRAEAIARLAQLPTSPAQPDPPELQQLKSQLEGLEALGYNPALVEAKHQLQTQIANYQAQLKVEAQQQGADVELLLWACSENEMWQTMEVGDKRSLYRTLASRVLVKDGVVVSVELKV